MLSHLLNYEATEQTIWQGRKDSLAAERFFQKTKLINLHNQSLTKIQNGTAILGFCSEEGIRRNEGRIGAKLGPLELRKQLAKLAFHAAKQFVDVGNIVCETDLESAQQQFSELVHYCHQQGYKTLALGGGHEIAWGHFCGLTKHYPKLGIINFDAHFDLRSLKEGQYATSGSPFFQIAEYCSSNSRQFNYCCLGIQKTGNTNELFTRADSLAVSYLTAEQIYQQSTNDLFNFLNKFIAQHDHIYLGLCLDVFAECFAPGVSAPQALGLTPWQVVPLLKYILQTGKVIGVDIAELSPPLDTEHKTARLAANIAAELLYYY